MFASIIEMLLIIYKSNLHLKKNQKNFLLNYQIKQMVIGILDWQM